MPDYKDWRTYWRLFRAAASAYGYWQFVAVFGIAAVINTSALAFMENLRNNLTWFGQIWFAIGIFLVMLVVVKLASPYFFANAQASRGTTLAVPPKPEEPKKSVVKPKIVFGDAFVHPYQVKRQYSDLGLWATLMVPFTNEPDQRDPSATIPYLAASLTFLAEDKKTKIITRPITTLWSTNPPSSELELGYERHLQTRYSIKDGIDLLYQGEPRLLMLVVRPWKEDACYAMDAAHFAERNQFYRITDKVFYVDIRLTAYGIDKTWKVKVENPGKERNLILTQDSR